jgi:hypothetical protein
MPFVRTSVTFVNADAALASPEINAHCEQFIALLEDLLVPLFSGKSSKQQTLDLVHPVLNAMIEQWLELMGWQSQTKMHTLLRNGSKDQGTVDFSLQLSDGRFLVIEVQFGNGGRIERDFSKLEKLHGRGALALGFLVYFDQATALTADSGLADYEKVVGRQEDLKTTPTCVIGLSRRGCESVNLQDIPGIVFPSVLGGSGKHNKMLRAMVAQTIIDRKPLSQFQMSDKLKGIVRAHAIQHTLKSRDAWLADVHRILECDTPYLRDSLIPLITESCKSSLVMAAAVSPTPTKSRAPRAKPVSRTMAVEAKPTPTNRESATNVVPLSGVPVRPCEGPVSEQTLPVASPNAPKFSRAPKPVEPTKPSVLKLSDFPARAYHAPRPSAMADAFLRANTVCAGLGIQRMAA